MKLRLAALPVLSSSVLTTAFFVSALSGAVLLGSNAAAEEVRMPVGSETYSGSLPKRGTSKATVEAEFGTPNSNHGPNGEPPIYYWEYPDFTVYFEGDYVIHTVIKKRK